MTTDTTTTAILKPARRAVWRYVGGLAPVILLWAALAGWLAWQLVDRARWSEEADRALIREWIDETRMFRQTLPELVEEYILISPDDARRKQNKRDEIAEQLRAMAEPTRVYANQLPAFPEIFSLSVRLKNDERITWTSPVPRPAENGQSQVRTLTIHPIPDDPAAIECDYRLHAYNRLQKGEEDRRQTSLIAGVLLVTATILAALFVWRFLRREHDREIERLTAVAEVEHRERELLAARVAHQEAEQAAQNLHSRAIEAEKQSLEIKSQIYAGIGIMAGSYAHNIKNLLVRPNDLLARCLEEHPSPKQEEMLREVKNTLGTVTERLQEILRTVRRDPQQSKSETVNLTDLVRHTAATWQETARDKWKLNLQAEACTDVSILGDASHLQQALENLVFNARDATFEMRNHLREVARRAEGNERKDRLLAAAAWKGEVTLTVRATPDGPQMEIRDNGIGMTEAVKSRCLETHFSTKRDNALYEGYSAGMGLGLSFVAMVMDHHGAKLAIESAPLEGTTFRITFPVVRTDSTP